MDQALLVDQRIADGQELVDLLAAAGFDVTAAAWVKPGEEDGWLLYIVSKVVDEQGMSAAYRGVHPVLRQTHVPWASLTELKLVGLSDPVAIDILDINRKYPRRGPMRSRTQRLGGMAVAEAILYPSPGLQGS